MNKNSRNKNYYNITNNYIAGFIHADGSFSAPLIKGKNKLYITPQFNLSQHKDNQEIILLIKNRFSNIGNIIYQNNNIMKYKITNISDINQIIIPFFDKYQVRSNKYLTFLKFKLLVNILNNEKPIYGSDLWLFCLILSTRLNPLIKLSTQLRYLNKDQQDKIINYILPWNLELENIIKKYNSDLISLIGPNSNNIYNSELIHNTQLINSEFINGLIDGDGSLYIGLKYNNNNNNLNLDVKLQIVQDIYNKSLLLEIKEYFDNKGNIRKHNIENTISYYSSKSIILNNIIPRILNIKEIKSLNWEELAGPNIKLYKFYNLLKINELLSIDNNSINDSNILDKIIEYIYNTIKNPKNITLKEYKSYILNKIK